MAKMFIMPLDEVECDLQILQIEEGFIPPKSNDFFSWPPFSASLLLIWIPYTGY